MADKAQNPGGHFHYWFQVNFLFGITKLWPKTGSTSVCSPSTVTRMQLERRTLNAKQWMSTTDGQLANPIQCNCVMLSSSLGPKSLRNKEFEGKTVTSMYLVHLFDSYLKHAEFPLNLLGHYSRLFSVATIMRLNYVILIWIHILKIKRNKCKNTKRKKKKRKVLHCKVNMTSSTVTVCSL